MNKFKLPNPQSRLLTRKALADRWSCSVETIKRREIAGVIVGIRIGGGRRRVLYRLSDIEAVEEYWKA